MYLLPQDSLTTIPELKDHLRIFRLSIGPAWREWRGVGGREAMVHTLLALPRPRKLTLKGYRQYWVVFKDTTLSYYKSQDEAPGDPTQQLNLKGKGPRVATALSLRPPQGPGWVLSAPRTL